MMGVPASATNVKGVTGTAAYNLIGNIIQSAVASKAKL
jgi:hypothetical protein